jgi:hypothetical protein
MFYSAWSIGVVVRARTRQLKGAGFLNVIGIKVRHG